MAENDTADADIEDDEIEEIIPNPLPPLKVGAPPWIVTFADLSTLMLTFFVLLLSFANMDVVEFRQLMGSMGESFGSTFEDHGKFQHVGAAGSLAEKLGIKRIVKQIDPFRKKQNTLADLAGDAARRSGLKDEVKVFYGSDGITVRISDSAVFDSGKAILKPQALPFLKGIAEIARSFNFRLLIEGHTDNIPIRTRRFPSNWELSTIRATTVLRKLLDFGAPRDALAAVGYADRKPVKDNSTPRDRKDNRRVEFKFIKMEKE